MNKQRNATFIFPCSFAKDPSFDIPSASPKEEYSSSKPLKSVACLMHSSAISNCSTVTQNKI
jgi:hypothetical protein